MDRKKLQNVVSNKYDKRATSEFVTGVLTTFLGGGSPHKTDEKGFSIKVVKFSAQFHQKSVERVRLVTYVPENAP